MAQPCGNCDTCMTPAETWDATTAARKALSAILRTGQSFGMGHLVDLLLGVKTDKITRFKHDQLPTFGVGTELDRKGWASVFRQLIVRGLIEVDHDAFGALCMTATAEPVLRGQEQVHLRRERSPKAAGAVLKKKLDSEALDAEASSLYETLRTERARLAREQGVPAYIIFHDSTLVAIAAARPATLEALGEIPGMGRTKLERYGATVLAAITQAA
jgi:ATP-dependent DNA helicase RecQ